MLIQMPLITNIVVIGATIASVFDYTIEIHL